MTNPKKRGSPPKPTHITHTTPDIEAIRQLAADGIDWNQERIDFVTAKLPEGSTQGSDLADEWKEIATSLQDDGLKQLLQSIYNDGILGNPRNMADDLQTIRRLTS
jgi:hypothetical protein